MSKGDLPAIISNISTPRAHQSTLKPEAHTATWRREGACMHLCVMTMSVQRDTRMHATVWILNNVQCFHPANTTSGLLRILSDISSTPFLSVIIHSAYWTVQSGPKQVCTLTIVLSSQDFRGDVIGGATESAGRVSWSQALLLHKQISFRITIQRITIHMITNHSKKTTQ